MVQLAVDTGAVRTLVVPEALLLVGYDPLASQERVFVTTASGVESCPVVAVKRFEAVGRAVEDFPLISHPLPPTIQLDGLLGLDFLRRKRLVIDFEAAQIVLD